MELEILKEAGEIRSLYNSMKKTSKVGAAIIAGTVAISCTLERVVSSLMPTYRGFTNLKNTREVYERFSK